MPTFFPFLFFSVSFFKATVPVRRHLITSAWLLTEAFVVWWSHSRHILYLNAKQTRYTHTHTDTDSPLSPSFLWFVEVTNQIKLPFRSHFSFSISLVLSEELSWLELLTEIAWSTERLLWSGSFFFYKVLVKKNRIFSHWSEVSSLYWAAAVPLSFSFPVHSRKKPF